MYKCFSLSEKLKFFPPLKDANIELYHDASVTCKAEGDGPVRIMWQKSTPIHTDSHFTALGGTLNFFKVQRSDEGMYTCTAYNDKQGSINATVFIDVVGKFSVTPSPLWKQRGV